jgi:hypothetical protein
MTSRRAGSFFYTPTHGRDTNEGLKTGAFQRHRRSATRVIGGPLVFSVRVRSDRLEQCDELMDFFYILFSSPGVASAGVLLAHTRRLTIRDLAPLVRVVLGGLLQ